MALPTNIQEQIKLTPRFFFPAMKGEKKAQEVADFIKATYPGVKVNRAVVYSLWKGSPRKFIKKANGGHRKLKELAAKIPTTVEIN